MTPQKWFSHHNHGQRILQEARESVCVWCMEEEMGRERKKMSGQKDGGGGGWGFSEHALCSEDASSMVQFNLLDQNKCCSLWRQWARGHPISEWLAFDLSQPLARTWIELFLPHAQMCMPALCFTELLVMPNYCIQLWVILHCFKISKINMTNFCMCFSGPGCVDCIVSANLCSVILLCLPLSMCHLWKGSGRYCCFVQLGN